ncbi:MAG: glycosyltransferase family 2 protein [Deltaproteobacteria bacterium]|nr:glycosyltransferase family 2 protein [Candidatus Zymogenaceae bacterium]
MSVPRISVIIINWNELEHVSDLLGSLRNQIYQDFEIIFVDNNSKDGSLEYVETHFQEAQVLKLDYNAGFAAANNRGIERAKGEYIALINSDTVVDSGWLVNALNCLENHPEAGFCASKLINYYDRNKIDAAGDLYTRGGVNEKRGLGENIAKYNGEEYVFGACAAAVLYRKSMLEEIGCFDEDFFIMCEDVDLNFRAQLAGYKCIYCPDSVVYHKVHGSIGKIKKIFSYYGQRNIEYVYIKNMPFWICILHLPLHLLYNTLVACYFFLKGELKNFLMAKSHFFQEIPSLMRKRQSIQKVRKVSYKYLFSVMSTGWLRRKIKRRYRSI